MNGTQERAIPAAKADHEALADSKKQFESGRTALWRAIAGMAVALAAACVIVAVEISSHIADRAAEYRTRISHLNHTVEKLKQEASADRKKLVDARDQLRQRDLMKKILLAHDLKIIHLAPLSQAENAYANIAMSESVHAAVLRVSGLAPLSSGAIYSFWWILKGAPPSKAAEFASDGSSDSELYLDLPPERSIATGCEITIEPSGGGLRPTGEIKLRAKTLAR